MVASQWTENHQLGVYQPHDFAVEVQADGLVVAASESVEDILGFSVETFIGAVFTDFFGEESLPLLAMLLSGECLTEFDDEPIDSAVFKIKTEFENSKPQLEVRLAVAKGLASKAGNVVVHGRDISRDVFAQQALEQMIYTLSHDLKNRLFKLLFQLDELETALKKEGRPKRDITRALQDMRRTIRKSEAALADADGFVTVQFGKIVVKPLEGEVVKEVIQELKDNSYDDANLKIRVALKNVPERILGNKMLLHAIFDNLIGNAIKYANQLVMQEKGAWVSISVESKTYISPDDHQEYVIFKVADNGIGIPNEAQEKIFEFGERARNTGSVKGTGMGLWLVKRAVERMGGKIRFESEVGVGTVFYIALPLAS